MVSPTFSMSGERCSIAPAQKTRPITAARRSTERCDGGRRSIRAPISACSESGIRSTLLPRPCSSTMRIVSSTYSGLPSVFSSSARRTSGSKLATCSASSASTSSSLSERASASSSIAVDRTRPPPQPGCTSSSSARARQRMRSGARTQSERCSISSSSGSSAQWMSSKPSTTGWVSASFSTNARAAQAISCGERSPSSASRTPDARPSRSATASSSQWAFSFSNASSIGSSSEIPATVLTISASGQYVMPSPYGRQRPTSTVEPSRPSTNSRANRLLPTPASP